MRNYFTFIALLFFLITACATKDEPQSSSKHESRLDSLFDAFGEFKHRINPIEATKGGDNRFNDQIANFISDQYQRELVSRYTEFIETGEDLLPKIDDQSKLLSLRVMLWDCKVKLEGLRNEIVTIASPVYDLPNFELMPVMQITSLHLYVGQLAAGRSVQPFKTVQDYDNWLSRLKDYIQWMETCIAQMKVGMAEGIVPPKILITRVIDQLNSLAVGPADEHLFYSPIKLFPEDIDPVEKNRLSEAYLQFITNSLIPTYQKLRDFMMNEYLPAGRTSAGIGDLPNGPKTYEYLIKLHTSTNMTADEIFDLGQREVSRIEGEMAVIKDQLGFEGDLRDFFNEVRAKPALMPFNQPEQVIENFNAIHAKMSPYLLKIFKNKPKGSFVVRRTEAFREASASAEYVPGSKDATRAGIFYVPIRDVEQYNVFQDEALFLHEAVPGHHYQLSLQQENQDLPVFLHAEGIGVFVEGWALYAESLGKELGLYEDPYQYFGMLSMEMHRAIRLVVDVGLHAKGWTREEAIQYSLDHEAEDEATIIAEIERYMATPGQALSYKVGQLKIRELRNRAEDALGEAFDVREYHDQVINSGSLPLVLLEEKIDAWINEQRVR